VASWWLCRRKRRFRTGPASRHRARAPARSPSPGTGCEYRTLSIRAVTSGVARRPVSSAAASWRRSAGSCGSSSRSASCRPSAWAVASSRRAVAFGTSMPSKTSRSDTSRNRKGMSWRLRETISSGRSACREASLSPSTRRTTPACPETNACIKLSPRRRPSPPASAGEL